MVRVKGSTGSDEELLVSAGRHALRDNPYTPGEWSIHLYRSRSYMKS